MTFSFEVESCRIRCPCLLILHRFSALLDARLYGKRLDLAKIDRVFAFFVLASILMAREGIILSILGSLDRLIPDGPNSV